MISTARGIYAQHSSARIFRPRKRCARAYSSQLSIFACMDGGGPDSTPQDVMRCVAPAVLDHSCARVPHAAYHTDREFIRSTKA